MSSKQPMESVRKDPRSKGKTASSSYPTAEDYDHYSEWERIYRVSGMYVGSDVPTSREDWLYDFDTIKIRKQLLSFPEAMERVFLEVLTNASDNVHRSRRLEVPPGEIRVTMNETTISVENGGLPIPVEIKESEGMYLPEMIFGTLGSSSNYKEVRHEAGVNGLGAKLTNIFSTHFSVFIQDSFRRKEYAQEWFSNMRDRREPQISSFRKKKSCVKITYTLDFARFGDEKYPPEAFALFARHCADISFTAKISVFFNDQKWDLSHPREYARLYFGDLVENSLLHYEWPKKAEVIKKKDGREWASNPSLLPLVEMCVVDTPDEAETISFVNSMMTRDGGVHVETAIQSISKEILKMMNTNPGEAKEKGKIVINLRDVRPHISLILACKLKNPRFSGQTKTLLAAPKPRITISEEELKAIKQWKLMERLYATLEAKQAYILAKTDGKKRRFIRTHKGQDANEAGKKKSALCTLYIVEGDSAKSYPLKMIDLMEHGRDLAGILPIRGKMLNVMNADVEKIRRSAEICEIKKMLGLQEGVDYTSEEDFQTLRYGNMVIMADADDDGKHIAGLLLNYFHCRFPSLLARGYVLNYQTPIIRVSKGKRTKKFYTQGQYEQWKNKTANFSTWKHKYFKGLGTSSDSEICEDFNDPHVIHCIYDADAPESIRLAFDKALADQRKTWLAQWRPVLRVEVMKKQPISDFIHHDLIQFSISNLHRGIPRWMDGLKESQRKVLWAMFKQWNIQKGAKEYQEFKVARFASMVAEVTSYHHGEVCLQDTIVGMAQRFTGSNNLPLLTADSQFGTRDGGGADAVQPRYGLTRPEWCVPYLFRIEDMPILDFKEIEGEKAEPVSFLPILPLGLINGANGIATGYSTFVPNHNPLDVSEWLQCRLLGKPLPELIPWYRDFSGEIEILDRRGGGRRGTEYVPEPFFESPPPAEEEGETEGEIPEEGPLPEHVRTYREDRGRSRYSLVTKGNFYLDRQGRVVVTELPIGRWIDKYRKWLDKLREDKEIKDYKDHSKSNVPYFEISGVKVASYKTLRLITQYGMSNMVLLDLENNPHRYNAVAEILETFYQKRLEFYEKRKEVMLKQSVETWTRWKMQRTFIQAVVGGTLEVIQRPREEIYAHMDELGLDHSLLSETRAVKFCEEEIQALEENIASLEKEQQDLRETPVQQVWLHELQEFETEYRKRYSIAAKGDKLRVRTRTRK